MKLPFNPRVLLVLIGMVASSTLANSVFAQAPPPLFPPPTETAPPIDLLKALPPVPLDWTLLKSTGSNKFSASAMPETVAIREYKVPPPPPQSGEPPQPIGSLTLEAFDTGTEGNGTHAPYPNSKEPEPKNKFDLPLIKGRLKERPDHSHVFYGPLGSRLLVEVTGRDMKSDDFKKILTAFNFAALATLEKALPIKPLKEVDSVTAAGASHSFTNITFTTQNVFVDELNPKANCTWQGAVIHQIGK